MKTLFCVLASFCAICIYAAEITGKVIKIYDGDTIRIEDSDGGKFKVRFSDIDAPEKDQPAGDAATAFLSGMVSGKMVVVKFTSIDHYGRIVGTVRLLSGLNVNRAMVEFGFAWWYRDYSGDNVFENLEAEARKKRVGIWIEENPIPPWQYRKEKRASEAEK